MKINNRVEFWIDKNDSGYASELYGVESQNDWYDIQYYPEKIEGIIIWNKGLLLAQHVFKGKNGELRGEVFDISKKGIKNRILSINEKLKQFRISINDFNCDLELECNDLNYFYDIKVIKK